MPCRRVVGMISRTSPLLQRGKATGSTDCPVHAEPAPMQERRRTDSPLANHPPGGSDAFELERSADPVPDPDRRELNPLVQGRLHLFPESGHQMPPQEGAQGCVLELQRHGSHGEGVDPQHAPYADRFDAFGGRPAGFRLEGQSGRPIVVPLHDGQAVSGEEARRRHRVPVGRIERGERVNDLRVPQGLEVRRRCVFVCTRDDDHRSVVPVPARPPPPGDRRSHHPHAQGAEVRRGAHGGECGAYGLVHGGGTPQLINGGRARALGQGQQVRKEHGAHRHIEAKRPRRRCRCEVQRVRDPGFVADPAHPGAIDTRRGDAQAEAAPLVRERFVDGDAAPVEELDAAPRHGRAVPLRHQRSAKESAALLGCELDRRRRGETRRPDQCTEGAKDVHGYPSRRRNISITGAPRPSRVSPHAWRFRTANNRTPGGAVTIETSFGPRTMSHRLVRPSVSGA